MIPLLSETTGLIVSVNAMDAPDLVIEGPFRTALVAQDIAQLYWSVIWPDVPERDIMPSANYDGVEILIHTPKLFSEQWCDTHSVWVHCRTEERAEWLAEQAGLTVLGEAEGGR